MNTHRPSLNRPWVAWIACLAVLLNLLGTPLSQASMGSGETDWLMAGFCSGSDSDPSALTDLAAQLDLLAAADNGEHSDHAHTCCCAGASFGLAISSSAGQFTQPPAQAPPLPAFTPQPPTSRYLLSATPRASPLC